MGWFDDLQVRVSEVTTDDIGKTISQYIEQRTVDAVVKIGDPPTGNLSAAQIAAGQRGGTAPVQPSVVATVPGTSSAMMKYLPFVAVGLAALLLLRKKSRS